MKVFMQRKQPVIALIILLLAALACGGGDEPTPIPTSTPPPPATEAATDDGADDGGAEVAAEPTDEPTPEPEPTDEPTPEPEPTDEPVQEPVDDGGALMMRPEDMLYPDLPQPALDSGWTVYSDVNFGRDVAVADGLVWVASEGGISVWDEETLEPLAVGTVLDGLLHNVVNAIEACDLGAPYIFIGTEGGLNVYDSATDEITAWTQDNTAMGSDSGIDTLLCVPDSQALIVGYDLDGVDVYRAATDEWTYYDGFSLDSSFALSLGVVGDLEEIWVGHIASVSVISADGTITVYDDENGLDNLETDRFEHFVEAIHVASDGTVWLGTSGGLTRVDGPGQFTFLGEDNVAGWYFWNSVDGIAEDADGHLWLNTALGGVCVFDPATTSCLATYEDEDGMADRFNSKITYSPDTGKIFYVSDGDGLSSFDGTAWTKMFLEGELGDNTFYAIEQAADGSVWIGGPSRSFVIDAYDVDGDWTDMEELLGLGSFLTVNAFYAQPDGMWIGHDDGASFYEYETGNILNVQRDNDDPTLGIHRGSTTAIAMDGQGRMWFGTGSGLSVWDGSEFLWTDLLSDEERADERSPRTVYDLLWDGSRMWVGAGGGLYVFDESDSSVVYNDENSNLPFVPAVHALAFDVDGSILVGADDNLFRYNPASDDFDLVVETDRGVSDIYVTAEGDIWLPTDYSGVYHWDGSSWEQLTSAVGLTSNNFGGGQPFLIDYLGAHWFLSREGGFARYVP